MNLLRRLASRPGVRNVVLRPRVRRMLGNVLALRFLLAAFATTQPLRLLLGEIRHRGELRTYTIRETRVPVVMRHGLTVETLFELFWRGEYEPPVELRPRLEKGRVSKIVDIGANVGMFAAWAVGRWPDAEIVSFEPAQGSVEAYETWLAASDSAARLIPAAACPHAGTIQFDDAYGGGSRQVADGSGSLRLPAVDVFPTLMDADFVKMDIEGGEWALLADPRFAELRNLTLVMEYHRGMAPSLPAADAARELLQAAGFTVGHGAPNHWGHGTLWAWKD